jgi:hypothetical protein
VRAALDDRKRVGDKQRAKLVGAAIGIDEISTGSPF